MLLCKCLITVIRNGKIVWKLGPSYRIFTRISADGLQLHDTRVLENMAVAHEEYLHQDDFDAVLDIIESDFLEYDD